MQQVLIFYADDAPRTLSTSRLKSPRQTAKKAMHTFLKSSTLEMAP
jgi:hypothetical protein